MFDILSLFDFKLPILSFPNAITLNSKTSGAALTVAGLVFLLLVRRAMRKTQYPLPPGPPRLPIVGNYFDMPKREGWMIPEVFRDMGRSLGSDIVSVKLFGKQVIVVNNAEMAKDLFQTRGHIYSSRPQLLAMHQIGNFDWFTGIMQPNDFWKATRKSFSTYFKASEYRDVEMRSAHGLLRALLATPNDFLAHFRRMNTATTMGITYGIDMADGASEHYVSVGEAMMKAVAFGSAAPAFIFDGTPTFFLRFSNWLLGWNNERDPGSDLLELPYKDLQRAMAQGKAPRSIVHNMLSDARTKEDEEMAKVTGANVFMSGANQSTSPIGAFVRAMLKYPEAQRRAQKEIDTVVGSGRLPNFDDQSSLPFVEAIVKEVLRWHPVASFATAHAAEQDDVYKGYFIPKGSFVAGNAWAILHDEKAYPDPSSFKPERWFERSAGEFPFAAFGFGKRLCPGISYTRDMLFITFASILAAFDITPVLDSAGKPVLLSDKEGWTPTLFSYPEPFQAKLTPRSEAAKQLVLSTATEEPLTLA